MGVGDLLLGAKHVSEVTVEKNNVSVKYWACPLCTTKTFGPKYFVTITNKSDHPIVVGPSLIDVPLNTDYKAIAKDGRERIWPAAKWLSGVTIALIPTTFLSWYLARGGRIKPELGIGLGVASLIGVGSIAIILPLYLSIEKLIARVMLREPFTIQPGKSITKQFWLKNPKDQFEINFDAIKVLK